VLWWQWVLIVLLALVAGGYAAVRALGAERCVAALARLLGEQRWQRISQRFGWMAANVTPQKSEEKPAAPGKLPPVPKDDLPGDSSDAAKQSLRRFLRRLR
jgi:hypothetical protein